MIAAIKSFIQQHLVGPGATPTSVDRSRLAAAALLIEVVRADSHFSVQERTALVGAATRKFELTAEQATELVTLAEAEANEANDLYQFTAEINRTFTQEQKLALLMELWRAALADEEIHHHEEYVIRKIADLIHLPHGAYISTKLRVIEEGGG